MCSSDLDELRTRGALVAVDTTELLSGLTERPEADWPAFKSTMQELLEGAARASARTHVRVYSEMVSVLSDMGRQATAKDVDALFAELSVAFDCRWLCGYARAGQDPDRHLRDIRALHTHVVSANGTLAEMHAGWEPSGTTGALATSERASIASTHDTRLL